MGFNSDKTSKLFCVVVPYVLNVQYAWGKISVF